MSRLILINGDLAAGKSSLADALSLSLSIPCFKKDPIKERFCDMYGYSNREENRKLSVMAVNYMIDAFERFASLNSDVILEANFRNDELSRIKEIADKYKVDVISLILRGDIDILYERFLKRLPTRHKAHMSLHLDESVEVFEKYINELRNEDNVFLPHIIDTSKKNENEVLQIALKYIK